jgi:CheY-like chemotaxis protein
VKVMIVDDDKGNRNAFRTHLTRKGIDVDVCSRGDEALERIKALHRLGTPPDVVVTDQRMPAMSGTELIDALRRTWPRLPVVLMSAYGSDRLAAYAQQMDAAYLEKPFPPERLIEVIGGSLTTRGRIEQC